jgi:hypothetical protein
MIFPSIEVDELYERAREVYGEETQIIVALEELSELQKELCKYLRGNNSSEGIAEEMADVIIMLEQLFGIFSNAQLVTKFKCNKKARLWMRVLEEERKQKCSKR